MAPTAETGKIITQQELLSEKYEIVVYRMTNEQ
jgi:hypothetical protein